MIMLGALEKDYYACNFALVNPLVGLNEMALDCSVKAQMSRYQKSKEVHSYKDTLGYCTCTLLRQV